MLKWLTTEGDPVTVEQPYRLPDWCDDAPDAQKTTFYFRTLTQVEQARIQAAGFRAREVGELSGKKLSDDDLVEGMNEAQVDAFAALCVRIANPSITDARKIREVFRAMPSSHYQTLLGLVAARNSASDLEGKGSVPQSSPAHSMSTSPASPSTGPGTTTTTAGHASVTTLTPAESVTSAADPAVYQATGD